MSKLIMESKIWWYELNNEQRGPIAQNELDMLINQGFLSGENLVWKEGVEDWIKITELNSEVEQKDTVLDDTPSLQRIQEIQPHLQIKKKGSNQIKLFLDIIIVVVLIFIILAIRGDRRDLLSALMTSAPFFSPIIIMYRHAKRIGVKTPKAFYFILITIPIIVTYVFVESLSIYGSYGPFTTNPLFENFHKRWYREKIMYVSIDRGGTISYLDASDGKMISNIGTFSKNGDVLYIKWDNGYLPSTLNLKWNGGWSFEINGGIWRKGGQRD